MAPRTRSATSSYPTSDRIPARLSRLCGPGRDVEPLRRFRGRNGQGVELHGWLRERDRLPPRTRPQIGFQRGYHAYAAQGATLNLLGGFEVGTGKASSSTDGSENEIGYLLVPDLRSDSSAAITPMRPRARR